MNISNTTDIDSTIIEDLSNNVYSIDISDESLKLLKKSRWKKDTPLQIKEMYFVPTWEYSEFYKIEDLPEYKTICDYCISSWHNEMLVKESIILDKKNKKLLVSKSAVDDFDENEKFDFGSLQAALFENLN